MIEQGREMAGKATMPASGGGPDAVGRALTAVVAAAFGVGATAIAGQGRGTAAVAFARQVTMYLAHTRLHLSFTAVGRLFGRDRTTARHACRQVEDRREDPRLDSLLDCLERAIDLSVDLAAFGQRGGADVG
jgi:hypothetical protein